MDDAAQLNRPPAGGEPISQPAIAVFDLDNTLTRHGTWTPFVWRAALARPLRLLWLPVLLGAAVLYAASVLPSTRMKALMLWSVLGGRREAEIAALARRFVHRLESAGFKPGARAAIERHRREGARLVLATASFEFCATAIGERLGFDLVVGSRAGVHNGRLTGRFQGSNCEGGEKVRRLREALAGAGYDGTSIAYSDHHRDRPLLDWADRAVCVDPTPALAQIARQEGWPAVAWSAASEEI